MNYTTDDQGRSVPAVGAPGSLARFQVEHPNLIAWVKTPGRSVDEAVRELRLVGYFTPQIIAWLYSTRRDEA